MSLENDMVLLSNIGILTSIILDKNISINAILASRVSNLYWLEY